MSLYQDNLYAKQFALQKMSLKKIKNSMNSHKKIILVNKKHCLEF